MIDPPGAGNLREEPVGAAIGVVGDDRVVAGTAHRANDRVLGREARGEGEARRIEYAGCFEGREALLERRAGRIAAARVLVPAP